MVARLCFTAASLPLHCRFTAASLCNVMPLTIFSSFRPVVAPKLKVLQRDIFAAFHFPDLPVWSFV